MTASGLFINLYDETSLNTYIASGVYGPLMKPLNDQSSQKANGIHFSVFADLACAKPGTHVFFFRKRRIYYGGKTSANSPKPAVVLNGTEGRMAVNSGAAQVWKEIWRPTFTLDQPYNRIYIVSRGNLLERNQPYLLLFENDGCLSGKSISSDELYFHLGRKPYPLPANAINEMSFCTLTPYEVTTLLRLLNNGQQTERGRRYAVQEQITRYVCNPERALHNMDFKTEAELEAHVIACPELLPLELRPTHDTTICRQVPLSPFKPSDMDRADICYYQDPLIDQGAIPNVIIELKNKNATNSDVHQVRRYLRWIDQASPACSHQVRAFLLAPGYPARGVDKPDPRIRLFTFAGTEYRTWKKSKNIDK
jgi:hypothetical protein